MNPETNSVEGEVVLPCPFCWVPPKQYITDPCAPFPGYYFTIECINEECPAEVNICEKRRTDLHGMTNEEAEASIWPEVIAKWNFRQNRVELAADLATHAEELERELTDMKRWKKEAALVLSEWESVWVSAGSPGTIGQSKAAEVRKFLENNTKS